MKAPITLILSLTTVATLCGATTQRADAFCVYNGTDKPFNFGVAREAVKDSSRMTATIEPGKQTCCHWTDKSCNPSQKRDAMVLVWPAVVKHNSFFNPFPDNTRCGVPVNGLITAHIQAGGYWTIKQRPGQTKGKENIYAIQSWSYDHKLLNTYMCPWTLSPQ